MTTYGMPLAVHFEDTTELRALFLTSLPYPMPQDTFTWDARQWTAHTIAHAHHRRGPAVIVQATLTPKDRTPQ